jgi:hypothetical protein
MGEKEESTNKGSRIGRNKEKTKDFQAPSPINSKKPRV